ncbi:MAG: threonine--tRNA ligase, partial [Lachnospiraceae bacterium]|nr:threonine--tRNA ligase [Lachnospiraceae bacterium]
FGSMERFIGILIENFKAAFPFWMSPEQVGIVPIKPEHNEYAEDLRKALKAAGVRVNADLSEKNMNEKIKGYRKMKFPYILVVGDKEMAEHTVSLNIRGVKTQLHDVPVDEFIEMCRFMNEEKPLELLEGPAEK